METEIEIKNNKTETNDRYRDYDEASLDASLFGLLKHVFYPDSPLNWNYENIFCLLVMMDRRKSTTLKFEELFESLRKIDRYLFEVKSWDNFYYLPSERRRKLVRDRKVYLAGVYTVDREKLFDFYKRLDWACKNKNNLL